MTDTLPVPSGHAGTGAPARQAALSDFDPAPKGTGARILVAIFVGVPFLALLAAIPLAWGWGLGWHDIVIGGVFYAVSGLGVTVGFHRYFTHRSFKATRPVHIALAVAGSLALEGDVLTWVADHRRHHKYSDREGDPHSPWRFGSDWKSLAKGMAYAHMGWFFERDVTSQQRFCPDLMADRGLRMVSRTFPLLTAASLPEIHRARSPLAFNYSLPGYHQEAWIVPTLGPALGSPSSGKCRKASSSASMLRPS